MYFDFFVDLFFWHRVRCHSPHQSLVDLQVDNQYTRDKWQGLLSSWIFERGREGEVAEIGVFLSNTSKCYHHLIIILNWSCMKSCKMAMKDVEKKISFQSFCFNVLWLKSSIVREQTHSKICNLSLMHYFHTIHLAEFFLPVTNHRDVAIYYLTAQSCSVCEVKKMSGALQAVFIPTSRQCKLTFQQVLPIWKRYFWHKFSLSVGLWAQLNMADNGTLSLESNKTNQPTNPLK